MDGPVVKLRKPKESLQLLTGVVIRPLCRCLDLERVFLDDMVAQEGDRGGMELAYLSLYEEGVLHKTLEYKLDMLNVFLGGPGEDEDVVQVYKDKQIEHIREHIITSGLKNEGALVRPNDITRSSTPSRSNLDREYKRP